MDDFEIRIWLLYKLKRKGIWSNFLTAERFITILTENS
jgi:hypothetical protein